MTDPTTPDRSRLPIDVATPTSGALPAGSPVRPVRPPAGAPNVLVILIDDMGFGASSPFGGPCRMPNAERLAEAGLRYNRFHVTALCSPSRQALMTGRNHHSVGMGVTTEMATSQPGYSGFRPASAATMAQILSGNGYSTAAFGKWHQTPPPETGPSGPFTRWPTGEGFDHFYGFMGAEMNHWYPQLYEGTTPVEPDRRPEDGYHLSEDLVDHASDWIRRQHEVTPDKPTFCYLAFGATHAPFHVGQEWQQRYAGAFDHGWDEQRNRTLAEQKRLGIVPEDAELAPWVEEIPHWADLDDQQRRVAARFMETYAGFAEHTDAQIGRLLDDLETAGVLDDTVVVLILGDNGASGEGGIEGTMREHLVGHGIADDVAWMDRHLDRLGGPHSYGLYPVGWALAMNTPYQWTKQVASHYGGTRDGMIVSWPQGIAARGEIRSQWHHLIDILPTVLDVAGVPEPVTVGGVPQQPIEGTSMRYSFDDPAAPDRRRTQYFEMVGNRAIYHEGWTAVAQHSVPWRMVGPHRPFAEDVWELYDTGTDWTQAHDLADTEPERLATLQQMFDTEAERHQVLPLDDRVTERENPQLAGRIELQQGREVLDFGPTTGRLGEEVAPNVKNRSHRITVELDTDGVDSGVLVAQGGRFGGWSLYCVDGVLGYAYNCYGQELTTVTADRRVPAGRRRVAVDWTFRGSEPGGPAEIGLTIDDQLVGSGELSRSTAFYFAFDETFNVGVDRGSPVTDAYPAIDNRFSGRIGTVRVELAPPDRRIDSQRRRVMTLADD
ncbi:arylsulfatase [Microlunatus soli]|uniref:Arylsulfatase n=1 Tax=Microlunatus soli TaxID=630515 RepID=A0A1H1Y7Z2_9ACTN|nr:arylsulfatase [Microlunatus soli]SDT17537.1 arylsulfatase [Microlunatus soli]